VHGVSSAPEGNPSIAVSKPQTKPMPSRHKLALGIAVSIPLATCAIAFSLGPSPEKRLVDFYSMKNEHVTLELARSGEAIVPLLVSEVRKKELPNRTDAIRFLGNRRAKPALPALEAIVADESEHDEIRAGALEAILLIDRTRGLSLAVDHRGRGDALGSSAKELVHDSDFARHD
jgi:hypothetical protein